MLTVDHMKAVSEIATVGLGTAVCIMIVLLWYMYTIYSRAVEQSVMHPFRGEAQWWMDWWRVL